MLAVMFHAASSADFSTLAGTSTDVIFNAPLSAAYYVPAVTALGTAVLVAFSISFCVCVAISPPPCGDLDSRRPKVPQI